VQLAQVSFVEAYKIDSPNLVTHSPKEILVVVICTTYEEAEDVFQCQPVFNELDLTQDKQTSLATIVQSDQAAAVLRNWTKFYPVLSGLPTGIYLT
jgi:hypothetical protein